MEENLLKAGLIFASLLLLMMVKAISRYRPKPIAKRAVK